MRKSIALTVLLCALSLSAGAQRIEKLDLVLGPPTRNTDRGDGYGFEMRGDVFAKSTTFDCGQQPAAPKLGRYLLKVRYQGGNQELIATWAITLGARTVAFESYSRFELDPDGEPVAWVYEGEVLRAKTSVITDFSAASPSCFGGRLTLFFLESTI